nr:hypothetical protein [Cereibacter changlensis]
MIRLALQRSKARIDRPRDPGRQRIRTFERENLQRFEGGGNCVGGASATKLNEDRLSPSSQRHINPSWLSGFQASAEAFEHWLLQSKVLKPARLASGSHPMGVFCDAEPLSQPDRILREDSAWRSCRSWEGLSSSPRWEAL